MLTADTITDEQIRHVRDIAPDQFGAEACADALGLPPGPYDAPRTAEEMAKERQFQRAVAAEIFNARMSAPTVTDEQIRELRAWAQSCPEPPLGHSGAWVIGLCAVALGEHVALLPQHEARRECAELIHMRALDVSTTSPTGQCDPQGCNRPCARCAARVARAKGEHA